LPAHIYGGSAPFIQCIHQDTAVASVRIFRDYPVTWRVRVLYRQPLAYQSDGQWWLDRQGHWYQEPITTVDQVITLQGQWQDDVALFPLLQQIEQDTPAMFAQLQEIRYEPSGGIVLTYSAGREVWLGSTQWTARYQRFADLADIWQLAESKHIQSYAHSRFDMRYAKGFAWRRSSN